MKKILTLLLSSFLTSVVSAQHVAGFQAQEARDLIQVCNSFTYLDLYGSDASIIPADTKKFILPSPWVWIINFRFTSIQLQKKELSTSAVPLIKNPVGWKICIHL